MPISPIIELPFNSPTLVLKTYNTINIILENLSQYHNITLEEREVEVLYELENLIGEPIPDIRNKSMATFGLIEKNYHVVDLRLFRSFFFQDYKIKQLPESIAELTELISLDLSHNLLTSLPRSLSELKELQHLYVDFNQIETLPSSISELTYLRQLNLDDNRLKELKNLENNTYLQSIQLAGNHFQEIPESIQHLRYLRRLNISRNFISTLSYGTLENLLDLYVFDLRDNNIPEHEDVRLKSFLRLRGVNRSKFRLTGRLHPVEHPYSHRNIKNKIKSEPHLSKGNFTIDQLREQYLSQYT